MTFKKHWIGAFFSAWVAILWVLALKGEVTLLAGLILSGMVVLTLIARIIRNRWIVLIAICFLAVVNLTAVLWHGPVARHLLLVGRDSGRAYEDGVRDAFREIGPGEKYIVVGTCCLFYLAFPFWTGSRKKEV